MNIEDMIKDNEKLVYFILHKYYKEYVYDEDIQQTAMIGLWKGCKTYDPSRKISLSTYLSKCIINEINQYFRRLNRYNKLNISSIDTIIDEDNEHTINDLIPDSLDEISSIPLMLDIKEILTDKEYHILCLYLLTGKQTTAANLIGLSQSYTSRILLNIKNKIKDYICESNNT